jgi:hypothetical protein
MTKQDKAVKDALEELEQQVWVDPKVVGWIFNALHRVYERGYHDRNFEEVMSRKTAAQLEEASHENR